MALPAVQGFVFNRCPTKRSACDGRIHLTLQGKDGVGKSVIAAMLAQYRDSNGHQTRCIDTDPVDTIFHGYAALAVHQIALMEKDEIIPRRFDARVEMVAPSRHDILIDNGASSLMPPTRFLVTGGGPAVLAGMGHELVLRSVVTGG